MIRTKSNHIFGPISKKKTLELYQNGSIKAEDEICTGNGFWFFLKEKDMVNRYLLGDEEQPFNPISEAASVLPDKEITAVKGISLAKLNEHEADDFVLPQSDDLEYPDMPTSGSEKKK